jgi:hypothetical protein
MSKKRYDEITKLLKAELDDEERVEGILKGFCEIMKYDPEAKTVHKKPCVYDEKQAANIRNYRQRKLEEGISTYITSGTKKYCT